MGRPQTIGPYTLETRLGAGGMGEVYQAYDKRLDRWVAIKLIRPEHVENATARERFRREARAAARLSHPSIVQIYDIVESDESDAIVLELVEGEPLSRRIARGPLPVEEAVRFGRQIAEGLAAAHARGLVHRDLKSENVMVTLEGQAKILDFGLAKRLEGETSLTEDQRVLGTFRSMSPEQARGLPVDHRSDLFSLGILLYEMLAGKSPFDGGSTLETLTRICSHRQTSLREIDAAIPEPVSRLVDRLLEKDALLRPYDAREVARILAGVSGGERAPVSSDGQTLVDMPLAATEPVPAHFVRSRRFPKKGWIAGAALLLLLALGAGLLWRLRSRPPEPLYVAVAKPETGAVAGDQVQLLASGLRFALVHGLLALDGARPIPVEQVDEVPGRPARIARALAAQEIVTSRLECPGDLCQVTLSRISGRDGRLLWSQAFTTPLERPYALQEAVQGYLSQWYPGRRMRPEIARLEVRPEDYSEYLRLRRAFEAKREGERIDPETLFARLEAIRRTSPRFLDAYVFESEVRQQRYKSARDPRDLDRAGEILREARELAPLDPRPPTGEFGLAMIRGDLNGAEAALQRLERLQPGDPLLMVNRGRLLARRGEAEKGLALVREGARRFPSWRNLRREAEMEYEQGRFSAARDHVDQLLANYPESYEGLTLLAQIEFLHGDLRRAAALYSRLVERSPRPPELSNLGTALMYLGSYGEAEKTFRRVRALEPGNALSLLNLADAVSLQGRQEEAASIYREVVREASLDATDWQVLSARAQAQAHLKDGPGAVETVQKMLRVGPEGGQAACDASLVYALLGDRNAALYNARKALQQGIVPRMFALPWFDPLRSDPAFAAGLRPRPGS
jgi:tetratricopeptide (TPR) repeat protein/tRNA A-37 threonylcarbamoyl transferase component Bud32